MNKILYQNGDYWVADAGSKGYEVYRNTGNCAVRVASIGHGDKYGLPYAIRECDRRARS